MPLSLQRAAQDGWAWWRTSAVGVRPGNVGTVRFGSDLLLLIICSEGEGRHSCALDVTHRRLRAFLAQRRGITK